MRLKKMVMIKKNGISAPEGYFDDLQDRLLGIAGELAPKAESTSKSKVNFISRLTPYLAYAASLVAILLLGSLIVKKTAVPEESELSEWEETIVAEAMVSTDPYAFLFDPENVNP